MSKMIFDTHAHYDCEQFDSVRDVLMEELPNKNVFALINVGVDYESSIKSVELSNRYEYVYAGVGLHPQEIPSGISQKELIETIQKIETLLKSKKVVGIGEIGLDYNFCTENKEIQKFVFEHQLKLARDHGASVMIHDRDAHKDVFEILKKYNLKGVIHCFSGDLKFAKEIVNLGMKIGIGGMVTFKNSHTIKEVVKNISMDEILIETDAPYLAPVPVRGRRCDSSMIKFIAQKIANIKNISDEEVLKFTKNNAEKLFLN